MQAWPETFGPGRRVAPLPNSANRRSRDQYSNPMPVYPHTHKGMRPQASLGRGLPSHQGGGGCCLKSRVGFLCMSFIYYTAWPKLPLLP